MEEIRIIPSEDGTWRWESTDEEVHGEGNFEDRSACITAAREAGGAETVTVTRGDGSEETHTTPAGCRIVLLRLDGSEVGELDPPLGNGAVGHVLTLTPPTSTEEAVEIDG